MATASPGTAGNFGVSGGASLSISSRSANGSWMKRLAVSGAKRTATSARAAGSEEQQGNRAERDDATDAHQFFSTLAPARAAFCLARRCWLADSSAMISADV